MKTGHIFDKEQRTLSAQPNLTWYASCTLTITNIRFTSPALVTPKSLTDG
jgi:hypothetical protein